MAMLWKKSSVPLRRRFISLPPPITHPLQSQGSSRPSGWRTDEEIKTLFEEWTIKFKRTYTGVKRENKFQVWRDNLRDVERHNNTGNPSWKTGLTLWADFIEAEFSHHLKLQRLCRRCRPYERCLRRDQQQQQGQ